MSIPFDADLGPGRDVQAPLSNLKDSGIPGRNHDGCPEKRCPHCDEYTTLLKKHLGVVESELSKLKGQKT